MTEENERQLAAAAQKQGQVDDLFHMDFGSKIKTFGTDLFQEKSGTSEIDFTEPFFLRWFSL